MIMTQLLEQAIAQVKLLSESEQDRIASSILKSLKKSLSSNDYRETTFTFKKLSSEFNELRGYYNLNNNDFASQLKLLKLLGEEPEKENKVDNQEIIAIYNKWSFTVSFLQMLNAWQWFFAGILLERNSYLTTQAMQMYYYAIFFSYGSFLSAHFKGNYTIADIEKLKKANKNKNNAITKKVRDETLRVLELMGQNTESYLLSINDNQNIEEIIESARREIWLVENKTDGNYIYVADKERKKGGEHEVRAIWYYSVFKGWESNINISYPDVRCFNENDNSKKFHSDMRNRFTYSIQMMTDELCNYNLSEDRGLTNDGIICLWQRESVDLTTRCPEAFWALEHIKVVVDLHTKLLKEYKKDSPYTEEQENLLKNLCEHHKKTGLIEVLKVVMPTILQKVGI